MSTDPLCLIRNDLAAIDLYSQFYSLTEGLFLLLDQLWCLQITK